MDPKKIIPFFLIFFLFLLQNSVGLIFPQKTPVLLLCGVLFYAFSEGPWFGALLGAYAGLLLEVFTTGRLGSEMMVLAATGFIFGRGTRIFFGESLFMRFLMPLLAFYFSVFFRFLLFYAFSGEGQAFGIFRNHLLLWDTLGLLVACPVVFSFLKKVSYGLSKS